MSTLQAGIATGFTPDIDPELRFLLGPRPPEVGAWMTGLLERERELSELDAAIREAAAGTGVAVAIEAGAGLGKTRLLQEARGAGEAAGIEVLTARATEL
ncbi:MAG TPA: hypothetical protein VNN15_06910, partial [Solirubrobacterales bacterium]|nr:hypothetical protein [Solirubrobacterales bacterium]